jgi:uncharacterized protein YcfJ
MTYAVLTCCALAGTALGVTVEVIWPTPVGLLSGYAVASVVSAVGGMFVTNALLRATFSGEHGPTS